MEKAGRQLQWEGCSVFIYRWVLHILEASNNLAYNRLPYTAPILEQPNEDIAIHGLSAHSKPASNWDDRRSNNSNDKNNNNDNDDKIILMNAHMTSTSASTFKSTKVIKSKSKSKSKSKGKSKCRTSLHAWKLMVGRSHLLRLVSSRVHG